MFNSPRSGGQRYGDFGASYIDENPLSASSYGNIEDPWSAAPSPSPPPLPPQPTSVFSSVIADATVPPIYERAFSLVDPTHTGETSVNSLSRVLGTSSLPATTIDKIVNLVSSRPRVSKLEFYVALALVALAQSGKDVSIEQVAALSSQNTLPEPNLDLESLPSTNSVFAPSTLRNSDLPVRTPIPQYTEDPWNTTKYTRKPTLGPSNSDFMGTAATGSTSTFQGTGLPPEWWRKQETARVTTLGQQGFILNRYMVYQVTTDRHPPVSRRYSEFVYLWEVLTRRYPFRLFPALPPKRIGPDEYFIEQRRRGLARALTFVINHPVIREDGVLSAFLTENSFETWRKTTAVSLEEESASKRVDRIEEMSIPGDLEDKISLVRGRVNTQIELWQRICILVERIIKRREAAAVRTPFAFRRVYLPTHFATLSDSILSPSSPASVTSTLPMLDDQGDLSRLTNTLRAVSELNERPWRGEENELALGVRQGLEKVAAHTQRQSELAELRTRALLDTTLEALKSQRDLHIATRDLLVRHEHLSRDQVDRLKKRVDTSSLKLEAIKHAAKEGWQEEADRLVAQIEKDQAAIAAQLHRRVFIRACLWHEMRVVLHNRENTLLVLAVQNFAREEQDYSESVFNTWVSLAETLEDLPLE